MPVPPSPAVTPAQQKNIGAAIGAVNTYIAGLLSVENKAADAGDLTQLRQLNGPFQDAVALKQQ
jgi:queuine/archaeosine tRNA-ribosyltransferase